jgi:archaeal flagellin FlaB
MNSKQFGKNDKAEVGIGTMIVFIATILVAAVAAGVLINTSQKLQDKSTRTGDEATASVGTSIEIQHVYGFVDAADIDYLDIYITLSAGSSPVDLEDVVMQLKTGSAHTTYVYEDNNLIAAGPAGDEFVVLESDGVTAATNRVLQPGELLLLRVGDTSTVAGTPLNFGEDLSVSLTLIPEEGLTSEVSFQTPKTFSGDTAFELY